jgi:integrase
MSLRMRSGKWHFRFTYKGQEYTGNTDLDATPQNMGEASEIESEARKALKRGKRPTAQIEVITFRDAVAKFSPWAKAKYRAHPNSFKRIRTSLSSALEKFNKLPVSAIDAAEIDDYKTWRATEHEVLDITIRHDLHALSVFFDYAIRHHWALTNPIDEVDIPSDADAERIHVLTQEEEEEYFRRAARFPNLFDVGRIMINQGVRPEEATKLPKADVNFETEKFFVFGKTKAAKRFLDMTTETRQILERRMEGNARWIFPSTRMRGSHIGRLNSAHDKIVAEAAKDGVSLNFVLYDLRHTFATRAAQTNIDLPTLAALLGHGSTRCVYKYVHPTAEHKKAAMKRYDRSIKNRKRKSANRSSR